MCHLVAMRLRRLWFRGCLWTTLLAACGGGGGTGAAPPPPSAEPQAIHVDARTGSDSNCGTESQPLRTIVAGLARLDAGDTLVVHAGDYRAEGMLLIEKTGSQSAPVRITGHSGDEVIVLQVAVKDSDWVELSGLTVIGPKTLPAAWRDMPQVVIDDPGVAIDRHEDWSTRVDKVNRKYSSYAHFVYAGTGAASWEGDFSAGINVVASRKVTLKQNHISLHTACIQLRNLSSGVLVEGNRLHHCLDALKGERRTGDAYSFAQSTIRSNHVEQIFREGIRLTEGAQHNVVEGNRVEYSGHSHIVTYGAGGDNTIRHNVVQYGGYYAETMRWPGPSGISLHTPGGNTVADGNYVAYQYDIALGDGNGIAVDYGTRVDHAPEYPRVVNNVIYRPMGSGVNTVNAGTTTIVHNTIVEAGHGTSAPQNGMGIRIWGASDNGNVIANNLIYAPRHGAIYFPFANLSGQAYLDHNLMHAPGVPLVGNGATVYADLASLHAAGLCLNSIAADPLFDDATQGLLRAGSPAIGKGTGSHSTPIDRAQQPRDRLAPTIGAYEASSVP